MTNLGELFEPQNDVERDEYALEALALSVQIALQKSMQANCISQKELAERLGVTPARVCQMLSSHGANLTLKSISKIARALEDEFELMRKVDADSFYAREHSKRMEVTQKQKKMPRRSAWRETGANDNHYPRLMAA